ncbi:BAH domain-containing protein [Mycena indigotica]|uniref:BAH domain-containing protein n=1 Tax=Mycena indigotica TaxID=2126181 RepID=A0A8H6S7G5_9AGAR|nr:BAH domain-containing protein [Mycena indigotica]KAF7292720.1 BAH domain-containing protein [Mycena indigotica]
MSSSSNSTSTKGRWTHKKARSSTRGKLGELSEKEWNLLEPFDVLDLKDKDGNLESFHVSDTIAIVSSKDVSKLQLYDYWIGKIKGIRGESESSRAWVMVNWYYSPRDVKAQIPVFEPSPSARYERIYSHHCDIVSATHIAGKVSVFQLLEDNADQHPIPANSFFSRYYFDIKGGPKNFAVMQFTYHDPATSISTIHSAINIMRCDLCAGPYNPEAFDPDEIQRWCPAPECRRGFHHRCLDAADKKSEPFPSVTDLILARIANNDDTQSTDDGPPARLTHENLHCIPAQLLTLAAQPLVRGERFGVAGNIAMIAHARRTIHSALSDQSLPTCKTPYSFRSNHVDLNLDLWYKDPAFNGWEGAIIEELDPHRGEDRMRLLRCPQCTRAI